MKNQVSNERKSVIAQRKWPLMMLYWWCRERNERLLSINQRSSSDMGHSFRSMSHSYRSMGCARA
jgi:hypothetical protein